MDEESDQSISDIPEEEMVSVVLVKFHSGTCVNSHLSIFLFLSDNVGGQAQSHGLGGHK